MPLLIWFGPVGGGYLRGLVKGSELVSFIARMQILYSFDRRQLVMATMIAVILAVTVVATLIRRQWRWREQDAFVVLSLAVFALYALSRFAVSDIRDHLKSFSYPGTALRDPKHDLVKRAGATITPEAVVYDGKGNLTYRGRIDDRYSAVGISRATAARHDLQDAIASTIAGKLIKQRLTQAVGCYIADFAR